jgi:hypothetical protein
MNNAFLTVFLAAVCGSARTAGAEQIVVSPDFGLAAWHYGAGLDPDTKAEVIAPSVL